MSIFEKGIKGIMEESNSNGQLASDVVDAVAKSPELAKDNGFKHAGQSAALDIYEQLLASNGVLPEDIASSVEKKAQRLRTRPRRETVAFVKTMREIDVRRSQT